MSLVKTLAKVAIGMAVAKGVSGVMKGGASRSQSAGTGGLFGGRHSPQSQGGSGLEDMMGSILGGGSGGAAGGGLGGLLEQLGGGAGAQTTRAGGGLQDMLGGLAGAAGAGGLLGGLAGKLGQRPQSDNAGFGQVLNSAFDQTPEPEIEPSASQEAAAALMLSAMIQAAKSDGKLDAAEQQKLMERLGDIDPDERAFVQAEMQKPVDVDALAAEVPRGMETQVYAMSVLGIDLDHQQEAQYLHQLAGKLGIGQQDVNAIHDQLGVPALYA